MPKLSTRDAEALFSLAQSVEVKAERIKARDAARHDVLGKLRQAARLIDEAGRLIQQ